MRKNALVAVMVFVALALPAVADTLANWTFETSIPATAGPFAAEAGVLAASSFATGSHVGAAVYSSPVGNGSAHSFSSNTWAIDDYYQFTTSTTGYAGVTLDWDETSSNTGPGQFTLQYSTDGTAFTTVGSFYTVLANAAPQGPWTAGTNLPAFHFTVDLTGVTALDNQANVYFRLVDFSTVAANGGVVGTGGTDRVDNFMIAALPEPGSLLLSALGVVALIRRR